MDQIARAPDITTGVAAMTRPPNIALAEAAGLTIEQHLHQPRPVSITTETAEATTGTSKAAFRKLVRKLGIPAVMVGGEPVVLLADFEEALRTHGKPLEARRRPAKAEAPAVDDDAALLAAAGVQLRSVRGGR